MKMDFKMNFTIRPKMTVMSKKRSTIFTQEPWMFWNGSEFGCSILRPWNFLKEAGATIHPDSLVKIRSTLVEKAIRSVPKRLIIYDREGKPAMELGGGNTGGMNTYYGTGSDLKNTYDPYTGELRPTVSRDIANMAKMVGLSPQSGISDVLWDPFGLSSGPCLPHRVYGDGQKLHQTDCLHV